MLKDLIGTSFKTFRDSHNTMPGTVAVRFERTIAYNSSDSFSYTAPCDGWFRVQVIHDSIITDRTFARWRGIDLFVLPGSSWLAFTVPLAKGETITIFGQAPQDGQKRHHCEFISSKGENAS